jgi:CHAT domain-containing protein
MLRSSHGVQWLSRMVALSAIVLFLSSPLTEAHAVTVARSPGIKPAASLPAQKPPDVRKLEAGKPIEREMKGGESHAYEITLAAGQYLYATVDQRGIDVAVQIITPDGKPLMEVDSPNGAQGDEPIMLIAEATGVYRLNVASLEQQAPAGKYEIRVKELRVATATDQALIEKNGILLAASQLSQEVGQLYGAGKYDAALPLAERALAISEQALGAGHADTAEPLNNLALLYQAKGDYAKAEPLLIRTLAINEKARGIEHPDTAYSLNNLAALYNAESNYAKAEPLYLRALAIREKVLGAAHPLTAQSLSNLALLYSAKGDYAKAEPLYVRALDINEKAGGTEHPSTALSLNNLAALYYAKGDSAKAEPLYLRALAINEKALGVEHPDTATSLNNLAVLYDARGDYVKAEPLYLRALAIREKVSGAAHPLTAQSLSNLALLYTSKGDSAKAEPLYLRVLAIREKVLGVEHPDTAETLNHLALLYRAKGDYAKAIEYQSRCNDVSDRDLVRNLATGSERQKLIYLTQTSIYTDATISLHTQSAPNDLQAKHVALNLLLQRKGRALDAMTDAIAALRRRVAPENQALLNQLQDVRSQLSVLTLRGPGREEVEKHRANLKALEEREEKLQNDISQRSAEFRAQSQLQPLTIATIQKALPSSAALIEFAQYYPVSLQETRREKRFGSPRYVAYVLPSQGESLWVELGEAKLINDAINAWRAVLRKDEDKPLSNIDREVKPAARKVDELVMQPVRRLLGHTRRVFISPDGLLNLIPFAALVDEKGRYLVNRYHFTSLTSGRDLLRLQEHLPSKQGMVIIANPDYGAMNGAAAGRGLKSLKPQVVSKSDTAATPDGAAPTSEIAFSQVEFPQLAGTEQESRALKALLPEATTMLHEQATKAAVKQVNAPSILHIATHGYFLEDLLIGSAREDRGWSISGQPKPPATRIENPLLRAGLALAGVNLHRSDYEGILTALEVSGLNLWGTKLVVLSACETGVGEVQNFNGVAGLRRALFLAGSESQMLSLWKVDDEATRDLMIDYYTRLKAGKGRSQALREVQLRMLVSKNHQHPYFWASFIESGEWANLDGRR